MLRMIASAPLPLWLTRKAHPPEWAGSYASRRYCIAYTATENAIGRGSKWAQTWERHAWMRQKNSSLFFFWTYMQLGNSKGSCIEQSLRIWNNRKTSLSRRFYWVSWILFDIHSTVQLLFNALGAPLWKHGPFEIDPAVHLCKLFIGFVYLSALIYS